jgi:glutathione S-transferase
MTLHIGNYNYSSWSLRAWLVLIKAELPFATEVIDLDIPGYKDRLAALSDAATVPVLRVNDDIIPDSLAIADFAAKCVPNLWPKDEDDRQRAKNVVAKMHTGFPAIRRECPMNLRRRSNRPVPQAALDEAAEIDALWTDCLARHDGPYLFKDWSIADAFYAPIATRFESYGLPRTPKADTYISELMSDPDYQDWEGMAFVETHILPETDAVNA